MSLVRRGDRRPWLALTFEFGLAFGLGVGVERAQATPYTLALTISVPFGTVRAATGDAVFVASADGIHLFDGTTGALLRTFPAPTPAAAGSFGGTVAVGAGMVAVGAPSDDTAGPGTGTVFLFDLGTGTLLRTIPNPSPTGADNFGLGFAFRGGTLVVGAPLRTVGARGHEGTVFFIDPSTGATTLTVPSPYTAPTDPDGFGARVATAGSDLVVGSFGRASLIDGATGALLHTLADPNPLPTNSHFGRTVGALGNNPLVADTTGGTGTGAVYLFDAATGALVRSFLNPNPQPSQDDDFGDFLAAVGGDVLVGASGTATKGDRAGAAYLFDGATGALRQTAFSPSTRPPDLARFGGGVVATTRGFAVGALEQTGPAIPTGTVHVYDACGNGIRSVGEQCDDGNLIAGDGCSPGCTLELCGASPAAGCRTAAAGKSRLTLTDKARDAQDALLWKWMHGAATSASDFGNPLATASNTLCLYDGSGAAQPLLVAAALADGQCGPSPCWQSSQPGVFKYLNPALVPSGLLKMQLKAGGPAAASISVTGKGIRLSPPPLPLTLPVTVQLRNSDTGVCWEATYSGTILQNNVARFGARSDP